jgi:hypothetical protein
MKITWRELFLVLIVIGFGMLLLEFVMAPRREAQYRYQCASNLKQIGLACFMYAQDNNETFPRASMSSNANARNRSTRWMDSVLPYVKYQTIFHCPSDDANAIYQPHSNNFGSYVINNAYYAPGDKFTPPAGASLDKIARPSTTLLVTDGVRDYQLDWPDVWSTPALAEVHPLHLGSAIVRHGRMIALYCDGHTQENPIGFSLIEKTINGQRIMTGLTIEAEGD